MKKVIISSLLACLSFGARAETGAVSAAIDAIDGKEVESEIREYERTNGIQGLQFGVGVPLMVPMTGYNGFIGWANKKSQSWWGRRIGARLDFQIPSALKAKAVMKDNNSGDGGYDIDVAGDILFINKTFDNVAEVDKVEVDIDDQPYVLNLSGANASVALKNQNIGGLIDFYPFGDTWFLGGIRLSGGYYVGKAEFNVSAHLPNNLPDDNGYEYAANSSTNIKARLAAGSRVSGRLNWKYNGPYAGLGFDLGLFRGLKIYMDAGVVFAKAPQLHDNDIYIPERAIQACIESHGVCDWVPVDVRKPNEARDELLTQAVNQIFTKDSNNQYTFGGVDYTTQVESVISNAASNGFDFNKIASDISAWLGPCASGSCGAEPEWLVGASGLINQAGMNASDFKDIVEKIESAASGNEADFDLQSLTDDYLKARADGVNDANDTLKDMKFVPMVRLGLMYRF